MSDTFKLKNGTVLLSTEAPGGIYNSAQLKKIAELCSKDLAIVKATEDQRLALFVKESEVDSVAKQLKAIGLGFRNYQAGLHQPVACLGELCETHEQPALATATDLGKMLSSIQLESPLKIGINGCARCCTPCQTLDIAVIGEASGYRISLGGKTSQVPELSTFFAEGVPAKDLPRLVKKVVDLFAEKAESGESLHEVLERCGVNDFVAALAPYSQDAAGRDDPFAMDDGMSEDMEVSEISDEESIALASDEEALEGMSEEASLMDETPILDEELLTFDEGEGEGSLEIEEVPIKGRSGSEALADDLSLDDLREDLKHDLSAMEDEMDDSMLAEDAIVLDDEPLVEELDSSEDSFEESLEVEELILADDTEMMAEELSDEEMESEEAAADAAFEEEAGSLPEIPSEEDGDDLAIEEIGGMEDGEDLEALDLASDEDLPELDADLLKGADGIDEDADTLALADENSDVSLPVTIDEDEGVADALMSDEEESRFEDSLKASIEEEKKMQESAPLDSNLKQREATLSFLENVGPAQTSRKPAAVESIVAKAKPVSHGFEIEGVDIDGNSLRVDFASGGFVDLDLSTVMEGESKAFRFGKQTITVRHESQGFALEFEGMKMFHPHLRAS